MWNTGGDQCVPGVFIWSVFVAVVYFLCLGVSEVHLRLRRVFPGGLELDTHTCSESPHHSWLITLVYSSLAARLCLTPHCGSLSFEPITECFCCFSRLTRFNPVSPRASPVLASPRSPASHLPASCLRSPAGSHSASETPWAEPPQGPCLPISNTAPPPSQPASMLLCIPWSFLTSGNSSPHGTPFILLHWAPPGLHFIHQLLNKSPF